MLPIARPLLYETWNRLSWPKVESVIGEIDVVHATGLVPSATSAPLVVTVHDLAFVHDPDKFSRHGVRTMPRAGRHRSSGRSVFCARAQRRCGTARRSDSIQRDFESRSDSESTRRSRSTDDDVERVRRRYGLPEDFVLFVGTLEPRKNLARLIAAIARPDVRLPLVVAGADGWGDVDISTGADDALFLGFVPDTDLPPLYGAASVFAYPSEREGFGLPVAEAMSQGTAVVTSRGTSTEEVAAGAAVLVDPFDVDSIAAGIDEASIADELASGARRRAASCLGPSRRPDARRLP